MKADKRGALENKQTNSHRISANFVFGLQRSRVFMCTRKAKNASELDQTKYILGSGTIPNYRVPSLYLQLQQTWHF